MLELLIAIAVVLGAVVFGAVGAFIALFIMRLMDSDGLGKRKLGEKNRE